MATTQIPTPNILGILGNGTNETTGAAKQLGFSAGDIVRASSGPFSNEPCIIVADNARDIFVLNTNYPESIWKAFAVKAFYE